MTTHLAFIVATAVLINPPNRPLPKQTGLLTRLEELGLKLSDLEKLLPLGQSQSLDVTLTEPRTNHRCRPRPRPHQPPSSRPNHPTRPH
jgi:hypothetical protein